jgi:predicted metal-binding protein
MVRRGAEVIFLGTCMIKPIPSEPVCKYSAEIAEAIRKKTGVDVVMGTH